MDTSPNCHNFSNMEDSGLETSPSNSLRTHPVSYQVPSACVPSGYLDILEPDLLIQWGVVILPAPLPCLLQLVWVELFAMKIGGKVVECLSLLHIQITRSSSFLREKAHILPSLSFLDDIRLSLCFQRRMLCSSNFVSFKEPNNRIRRILRKDLNDMFWRQNSIVTKAGEE